MLPRRAAAAAGSSRQQQAALATTMETGVGTAGRSAVLPSSRGNDAAMPCGETRRCGLPPHTGGGTKSWGERQGAEENTVKKPDPAARGAAGKSGQGRHKEGDASGCFPSAVLFANRQ